MFIRSKRVKKNRYAYLVKNRWSRRGARQRVSKYIGRIYCPVMVDDISFSDYQQQSKGIEKGRSSRQMILGLVAWVLHCHGFRQGRRKKSIWSLGDITVDTSRIRVSKGNNYIALNINNDYLCNHTLRRLLRFRSSKSRDEVALELAKAFVGAGIPIPKDVFIEIFKRVYKKGQSFVI